MKGHEIHADVMELVVFTGSEPVAERCVGSSPTFRTIFRDEGVW